MRIQSIQDKDPLRIWISSYCLSDVVCKILLGAPRTHRWCNHLTCGHFKVAYQTLRPMSDVLKFPSLYLPRFHRVRHSLQCLNPRHLIDAYRVRPRFVSGPCLQVAVTYLLHLLTKHLRVVRLRVQPIAAQMRFEFGLILKTSPLAVAKSRRQSLA